MKKLLPVLIIIVIAVLAFIFGKPLWNKFFSEKMIVLYTEQPVLKTNLCKYIESTGTVEPEELVNVGAQIGGMVIRFGPDTKGKPVDYGSRVKAGGILAQIDGNAGIDLDHILLAHLSAVYVLDHRHTAIQLIHAQHGVKLHRLSCRDVVDHDSVFDSVDLHAFTSNSFMISAMRISFP